MNNPRNPEKSFPEGSAAPAGQAMPGMNTDHGRK
jgi:hypothetical protein